LSRRLPVLRLDDRYRFSLAIPQGDLYVTSSRGIVQGLEADVTVGDIVSTLHKAGISIVDLRTKRHLSLNTRKECNTIVVNPPGSISLNAFTILRMEKPGRICVIGEEDMLVLPCTLTPGRTIIYGQPDVGAVRTYSSTERALKILKGLKPDIAITNRKV